MPCFLQAFLKTDSEMPRLCAANGCGLSSNAMISLFSMVISGRPFFLSVFPSSPPDDIVIGRLAYRQPDESPRARVDTRERSRRMPHGDNARTLLSKGNRSCCPCLENDTTKRYSRDLGVVGCFFFYRAGAPTAPCVFGEIL